MEEEIARYRLTQRPRPRSPSSSYVTQSSNGSSTNLPFQGSTIGVDMSERRDYSSNLLQDRLREKRAETLRVQKHRRDSDSTADSKSRIASSPIGSSGTTKLGDHRPSTSNSEKKGTMGVKEMEEAVDKLHKQNWDLKLDIFHRRKRQTELEDKNATLESRIAQLEDSLEKLAEVHTVNETLISELELRDQAVEEAVLIICEREATIERMEEEKSLVQAFDMDYSQNPRSSPPQLDWSREQDEQSERPSRNIKALNRAPSFLSDQSKSTEALRSLYRSNQVENPDLPELTEEVDEAVSEDSDDSHSPQLSVLSESSFTSVYGRERSVIGMGQAEQNTHYPIDSHVKSSPAAILPRLDRAKFLSLDHVASSPIRRIEGLKSRLESTLRNSKGLSISSSTIDMSRKSSGSSAKVQPYTNEYLHNHMPPTPDTMSTNALRHQRNSFDTFEKSSGSDDDRNSSDSRHVTEKRALPHLHSAKSSSTVQQNHHGHSSSRPHSSEDVTLGQGSHAGRTSIGADISSSTDTWLATAQEYGDQKLRLGVEPPRMFDFSSTDDLPEDSTKSIVRNLMFNNDHVSGRTSGRIPRSRSMRMGSEPIMSPKIDRGDDAAYEKANKAEAKEGQISNRFQSKPPVTSKFLSKPPLSYSGTNTTINNPASSSPETSANIGRKGSLSKRSRLPGFLGGRSETVPNLSAFLASESSDAKPPQASQQDKPSPKKRNNSICGNPTIARLADLRKNSQTSPGNKSSGLSAVPPDIKDNRTQRGTIGSRMIKTGRNVDGRPSTSGSLDSRLPLPVSSPPGYGSKQKASRGRGFGGDGADDSDGELCEYETYIPDRKSMSRLQDHGSPRTDISGKSDGNSESKMGKLKGVVMKSFGRRG